MTKKRGRGRRRGKYGRYRKKLKEESEIALCHHVCQYCGKEFFHWKRNTGYHSLKCSIAAKRERMNYKRDIYIKRCFCGEIFLTTNSRRKYHSEECRITAALYWRGKRYWKRIKNRKKRYQINPRKTYFRRKSKFGQLDLIKNR